LRGNFK